MKKRALSLLLVLAMVITLLPTIALADVSVGELGEDSYNQILSKTEYNVAPGVTETDVVINNEDLTEQNMGYVMEIDMSNPSVHIVAGYKDYQGEEWGMQTVLKQAEKAEAALKNTEGYGENTKIVGAINANFFNMSTGEPVGPLVMNGTVYHDIDGNHDYGYLAIFEDGHAEIIRDDVAIADDVVEAMGGANVLIEDGVVVINDGHSQESRNPRSAVGVKADGTVVLYEVDGRQAPTSVGMTMSEMAEVLMGLGCVDALLLDGGGSSTFCTRREGSDELTYQNSLSDGIERTVSGTILVASTAAGDGEFARAAVTPNGKYYTPGSEIQFAATGADAAGNKVELPEGLVWALEDETAGTISESGLFTAAENFTGEVKVLLKQGSKTVGSTTVYVQIPDSIEFANSGLNLKYSEEKDLGLVAKYKGNEVNYKVGDIIWDVSVETISIGKNGETEDVASGYMDGNTFVANPNNSLGNRSVESTVTATLKWDANVTDTMTVGIGKEPVVILDGGDNDGLNYDNIPYVYAAASGGGLVYEYPYTDDGVDGNVILVHYAGRGGQSSAEQVDIDNGEVRFDQKALKVNYDFTSITGTEGACIGIDHDITIPGNPTGIGVWVYAPEGTPNLWIRIRVKDGTGTIQTLNFTSQCKQACDPADAEYDGTMGGINWSGWKYLECQFDNSEAGTQLVGPFTLMAGETVRVMALPATGNEMGSWVCQKDAQGNIPEAQYIGWGNSKGCFYVDNLQFVYGANSADVDNPYITSLKVGTDLGSAVEAASDGSTVVDSNTLMFYSEFGDVINDTATGVEFARIYVDGVNLTDKAVISVTDGKLTLDGITMANGEHTVEVLVRDGYGNEATLTRSFQVQQEDSTLTAIQLTPTSDAAILGNEFVVSVGSNNMADVNGTELTLTVGEQVENAKVVFSDAYEGTYTFEDGTLTLSANKKADAGEAENIANIIFDVRYDLAENTTIQYKYSGTITYAEAKDGVLNTFAGTSKLIPVEASYLIDVTKAVVDGDPCVITVTDMDGKPVKGAYIYSSYADNAVLVGVTTANGKYSTYMFNDAAQDITPYAVKDGEYSFAAKTSSYTAAYDDALPHAIQFNSTVNGSTGKNISWLTNPLLTNDKAVMLYATKADYDAKGAEAFIEAEGTVEETYFNTDKVVVNANGVVVTGLTPDTTYVYKVGDGTNWSELGEFTTEKAGQASTSFFIISDTQDGDYADGLDRMIKANESIGKISDDYTFGIHVGDAVETAAEFADWDNYFKFYNTGILDETDVIHVMGNHEAEIDGTASRNIYNTGDTGYYSVENGCVYVAVIDFTTDRQELTEIAEWLKEDAAASSADWKFVVTHVPVYYTNVEAKTPAYQEILVPVCDELGIDAVFSGHDHSYARTYPMVAGEIDESLADPDDGEGTVYYVCGTLGGKYYSGTNNPDFHFATLKSGNSIGGTPDLTDCAVFLTVNADKNNLTITTYDYTGEQIDQYTKTRKDACDAGHDYSYNPETELLTCQECGIEVAAAESGFTGFAAFNETEEQVYFNNGEIQTGFITSGSDVYHACGENNIAHKCDVVDTRTCTENGYKRYVCPECEAYKDGEQLWAQGHDWDENHVCKTCQFQGIDIATVDVPESLRFYTYTGKAIKPKVDNLTYDGKTLDIRSSRKGDDGYASFSNNVEVGLGTITVEGRGDFYGTMSMNFAIIPGSLTSGEASNVTTNSATLSWEAAPGASKYSVERYSYEKQVWTKIATTDSTTFEATDLNPGTEYLYRISWQADIDGKTYYAKADNRVEIGFTTEACAHDYADVVTAPTCTDKGYTTHTCTLCGDSYVDSYVDALGHDTELVNVKAATCTEAGYTGDQVCKVCEAVVTKGEEIPALGHDYENGKCTRCGDVNNPFTDIGGQKQEIQDAIIWAYNHEPQQITSGYTDTEFCPNEDCTRAQVVTFLWRAAGCPEPTGECPFVDVSSASPYYKAILWAAEEGITNGVDATHFAPNETVTRAQVVTFLWRYEEMQEATGGIDSLKDADTIAAPYVNAVAWGIENGIITGYEDGTFRPNTTCTRWAVVLFMFRDLA